MIHPAPPPSTWQEIWSVIRHLPGWAMSAFLHGGLIFLLAFWIYHPVEDNTIPLMISWSGNEPIKPLAEQREVAMENPNENVIQEFTGGSLGS